MPYEEVYRAAQQLKKKYGESDPIELCKAMGIVLSFQSLGTSADAIKGFYFEVSRMKIITVNDCLPKVIQRIIIAHELGHAVLHKTPNVVAFHDVGLFNDSTAMEKEANLFAAELLLDDKEVLNTLNKDETFFTAAATMRVPVELLDFKFRVMKWRGFKLIEPPYTARSNFLKDMEVPENADYNQ